MSSSSKLTSTSTSTASLPGLGVEVHIRKVDWVDFSAIGTDMAYAVFEYVGPVTLLECIGVCRAWYWRLAPNQSNFFHGWLQSITGMIVDASVTVCGGGGGVGQVFFLVAGSLRNVKGWMDMY
jgi:hypothetical protein